MPEQNSETGVFKGYADCNSVTMGWSEDRATRTIQAIVILEDGRRIEWRGNFANQQGMDITLSALRTMGWDGATEVGDGEGQLAGFGGCHCLFTIGMSKEYRGKTHPEIKRIDSLKGRAHKGGAMSQDDIAKLNAEIRRHMGSTAPRPAQKASPAATSGRPAPRTTTGQAPPPVSSSAILGAIMSDEERARAIDAGQDVPPRPADDEPPPDDDSDLPF